MRSKSQNIVDLHISIVEVDSTLFYRILLPKTKQYFRKIKEGYVLELQFLSFFMA